MAKKPGFDSLDFADIFMEQSADPIKWGWNIFSIIDACNGEWVEGFYGESINTGGFTHNLAVIGGPHTGKTQFASFIFSTALNRIKDANGQVMDTENTLPGRRIIKTSESIGHGHTFKLVDKYNRDDEDARCHLLDGNKIHYNTWFDILYKLTDERAKAGKIKKNQWTKPIPDEGGEEIKRHKPTFILVDSFTEAKTETADKKATDKGIDDSGAKMEYIDEAGIKSRALSKSARLQSVGEMYIIYTASLSEGVDLESMPGRPKAKKMSYIDAKLSLKKVSSQFLKIVSGVYWLKLPKPYFKGTGSSDKYPKYALNKEYNFLGNTDLEHQLVTIPRNKGGGSGFEFRLNKSQRKGVIVPLTELDFLRDWGDDCKNYGISDAGQYTYTIDLYPEIKWRNTTIWPAIISEPKLAKAIEFTSWLKLLYYVTVDDDAIERKCSPAELRAKLEEMGYDWDLLLDTRSYHIPREQESIEKPFLSAMDLLKMVTGEYHPYWYPVKKEDLKGKVSEGNK